MILDCSFSREIDEEVPGERRITNSPVLRPSLDEHLASQLPGGLVKIPGFLGQDLHSHVCLAACSSSNTKRAHEIDGRGVFTRALMAVLRGSVPNKRHLTYVELVQEVRERTIVYVGPLAHIIEYRADFRGIQWISDSCTVRCQCLSPTVSVRCW